MDGAGRGAMALPCLLLAGLVTWLTLAISEWMGAFGAADPAGGTLDGYRHAYWPASGPVWLAIGLAAGVAVSAIVARRLLARMDGWCATCGAWMVPAAVVAALAVLLPGVTAPLLPIMLAAAAGLAVATLALEPSQRLGGLVATAVPAFVAGLLLTPIEALAWPGVGLSMPLFAAARAALLASLVIAMACPRGDGSAIA